MVLSLDTEVDTPPDPSSGVAASTAVSLSSSHSKPEDTAILSGMIININKVINLHQIQYMIHVSSRI